MHATDNTTLAFLMDILVLMAIVSVGFLQLWLHMRIRNLRNGQMNVPALSDTMSNSLLTARQCLKDLRTVMESQTQDLNHAITEGGKTLHEIRFVLEKAETQMQQFDKRFQSAPPPSSQADSATVEKKSLPRAPVAPMPQPALASNAPAQQGIKSAPMRAANLYNPYKPRNPNSEPSRTSGTSRNKSVSDAELALRRALEEKL